MTRREAALARFIASVRRFILFAAPYIVFAVGVLLVIAAWKVLGPGPAYDWVNALLLALFVVTVVWVGWRASWRPRAVVGAMLSLVILGFATGMAFSAAFPSMRPLMEARDDRVMADIRGLAADAGFTALVVPDGQFVVYEWPVRELADPAGFTLEYESGPWIAEYRATGPVSAEDFQSMVAAGRYLAAGQPVEPGLSQVIPEGVAHRDLTVRGGPAIGLEFVADPDQPASVLVTVIGDVVVRAWSFVDDVTPLVAAAESLVPLQ